MSADTQGDRMTNIEHTWTVMRTSGDADRGNLWRASVAGPRIGYGETIEVVDAEQLRGAVDELNVLQLALENACDDAWTDGTAAMDQYIRRARASLGGQ